MTCQVCEKDDAWEVEDIETGQTYSVCLKHIAEVVPNAARILSVCHVRRCNRSGDAYPELLAKG